MTSFRLKRRTVLKGLLGSSVVSIALPPLECMFNAMGSAHADGSGLPKRFSLFFWGNGNVPGDLWTPRGTGSNFELVDQLSPLESVKQHIAVITGMNLHVPAIRPHDSGACGIMTGTPLHIESGDIYTFAAPSIDQVLASKLKSPTRFASLEASVWAENGLSFNGPNRRNPVERSPARLFERLFGAGFRAPGDDAPPDPRLRLRRSALDAIWQEAQRLNQRLGAQDKIRLEQHMAGIRELEQRIARLEQDPPDLAACSKPAEPPALFESADGRPALADIAKAHVDLLAMAMACDQTRVVSLFFTDPGNDTLFSGASRGHHDLTHNEGGDQPEVRAIVRFVMAQFGRLIEHMASIQEGDGTLLDHMVVFATSDCSLGRIHSLDDYPMLLAGRCHGRFKNGIHYRSPSGESATKVLLSMLRAMDLTIDSFGSGEAMVRDGLGAIEA